MLRLSKLFQLERPTPFPFSALKCFTYITSGIYMCELTSGFVFKVLTALLQIPYRKVSCKIQKV